ncbi:hypothetical protein [Streptomyces sp. NPDC048644]|uniref:hypothetical protein n=1 Tax=Streptomyces sp. NPDC048644 TaxID=3365582 RepID=UPI00371CEEB1
MHGKKLVVSGLLLGILACGVTACGSADEASAKGGRPAPGVTAKDAGEGSSDAKGAERDGSSRSGKVTTPLDRLARQSGSLGSFKAFVGRHGTADQKAAVAHVTSWKGYRPAGDKDGETGLSAFYPCVMFRSDLPAADYDAADAGDKAQSDLVIEQEELGEEVARAFDAWWDGDGATATVQVFDTEGQLAGSGSVH